MHTQERNCELRMALQSVMKYFKRREQMNVEKSDTEDNGTAKVDAENDAHQGRDKKGKGTTGGLEDELQSIDGEVEAKLAGMLKEGENKRDGEFQYN